MIQWIKNLFGNKQPRVDSFDRSPFDSTNGNIYRGGYAGGKIDRMNEDWRPGSIGPNRMFQMDGRLLRERCWDLFHNNPYAGSAVNAYIANVIECGIIPERDQEWENAWQRWGGLTVHSTRECDITRDNTIYELMALWLTEIIAGGGCLIHYVDMPRRSQRVPISMELIGEERFADHVQSSGTNPKTANPVINGIEIDHATGRTVAYHIYRTQPNDLQFDPGNVIRLPAEQCEYGFIKDRIGAKRGTPLLKRSVMWLWSLGYYTDNELAASELKSSYAYMVKSDYHDSEGLEDGGLYGLDGQKIDYHHRAMVWRGNSDDQIQGIGPNVPGSDSMPWLMLIQRSIAVGVQLSYEEVFRDYSKGSFSSVRMARGQDKKRFRPLQAFTIARFGNPTVKRFDNAAVGALIDGLPSPQEFAAQRDALWDDQDWMTPGWESPNPKDDATANRMKLEDRTTTRKAVIGGEGNSWKKTFIQFEKEQDDMRDRNILPTKEATAENTTDKQDGPSEMDMDLQQEQEGDQK